MRPNHGSGSNLTIPWPIPAAAVDTVYGLVSPSTITQGASPFRFGTLTSHVHVTSVVLGAAWRKVFIIYRSHRSTFGIRLFRSVEFRVIP